MEERRFKVYVDSELSEIVPVFLSNRRKDIELISRALESEDFESIKRVGHTMKGSGGGYGFDFITDLGKKIEEAAGKRDGVRVRRYIEELLLFLDTVEVVYR
jgi:HPt (histidine-containing phosphotransfer) domain-containing protein